MPRKKPETDLEDLDPIDRTVATYARISVKRDKQSSTKTQTESTAAHTAAQGWTLIESFVEIGQSAYKKNHDERPEMRKLLQLVEAGAINTVVVWKIDRAARNTRDLLALVDYLTEHGVAFVSVTEPFDTTTLMGRVFLIILAALAEMESATKSDRTLMWHMDRRATGAPPAGRAPIGYVKPERDVLEVDPVKAPIISEAADRIMNGATFASVLRYVNDSGVKVSRPGLYTTMLSPTIAGLRSDTPLDVQNGVRLVPDGAILLPGSWEPIVDPETWAKVRSILRDPGRRTNTGVKLKYPLVPILRCGVCGAKMLRQNQKKRSARYICFGLKDAPGNRCLNAITQGPVDEFVEDEVLQRLDDGTWRTLRAGMDMSGPDPAKVEEDLARAWELVKKRKLDMEEYADMKAEWEGELAAARGNDSKLPDVDSVRVAWDGFDALEKHVVYRRAIKSLVINPSTRRGPGVDLKRVVLDLVD